MLQDFIANNRGEIISRCKAHSRAHGPRSTDEELEHGVPIFLAQLIATLRQTRESSTEVSDTGAKHGQELLSRGFTVTQVVRVYGGICQVLTGLAVEQQVEITAAEFRTLNLCVDDAIAGAVGEYGKLRDSQGAERLGYFAHELRNLLSTSLLSLQFLRSGTVGIQGSTGNALERSLKNMRNLVDRELTDVRLTAGASSPEDIAVKELIDDVEVSATMEANARGIPFSVTSVAEGVDVRGDRQVLGAVLANLLQNAFKFTRVGGPVSLNVQATPTRVRFEIQDSCGGLPEGQAEELFGPFAQRGEDRSGLGLGLAICKRGVRANGGELRVVNQPTSGCLFIVDLPRKL